MKDILSRDHGCVFPGNFLVPTSRLSVRNSQLKRDSTTRSHIAQHRIKQSTSKSLHRMLAPLAIRVKPPSAASMGGGKRASLEGAGRALGGEMGIQLATLPARN